MAFSEENQDLPVKIIWGRFHITERKEMFVLATITKKDKTENILIEIDDNGNIKKTRIIDFEKPFTFFHLASIRNGCSPSDKIHIYGYVSGIEDEMWYGCIDLSNC